MLKRSVFFFICLFFSMVVMAQQKVFIPPVQGSSVDERRDVASLLREELATFETVIILDSKGIISESYEDATADELIRLGEKLGADAVILGEINPMGEKSKTLFLEIRNVVEKSSISRQSYSYSALSELEDQMGIIAEGCMYNIGKHIVVQMKKEKEKEEHEKNITEEISSRIIDNSPIMGMYELENGQEVPLTENRWKQDDMSTPRNFKKASWGVGVPGVILLSGGFLATSVVGLMVYGLATGKNNFVIDFIRSGDSGILSVYAIFVLYGGLISMSVGTALTIMSIVFHSVSVAKIKDRLESDNKFSAAPVLQPNIDGTLTAGVSVSIKL